MQSLIHHGKSCFTGTYLCLPKVSFALISCPSVTGPSGLAGDRPGLDFNEAFSFQLSWAQKLFGSDERSRVVLKARKEPQALGL